MDFFSVVKMVCQYEGLQYEAGLLKKKTKIKFTG